MQLRKLLLQPSSPLRVLLSSKYPFPLLQKCSRFSSSSSSESQIPNSHSVEPLDDNRSEHASTAVSIDRSGLYNPPEHSHERKLDSELVKHLKGIIKYDIPAKGGKRTIEMFRRNLENENQFPFDFVKFRGGPISVAEYMEEVLTNPKAGFYINRDVFGAEGHFITSPEVSQMFGEMVGVWAMCLWEQMGQPNRVNLVELGPGRGTLMADLLRGASKFKNFTESLHIHLVECSPTLQKLQHHNLKCMDENNANDNVEERTISSLAGTPVSWHAALEQVPSGFPTIIVAHEFYDALPVHQFQKTTRGWCEKLVDIAEDSSFRFVLSPQPTPATLFLLQRCKWAADKELEKLEHIEVCAKAMELTGAMAKRIGSDGGGALIIDYGLNGVVADSLQAIRKHKFVDLFDNPGSADLSAYVDFASIRHSAEEASERVTVHGPMTQSQFLGSLGINFRVESLLQNCTEEQAESLRTGYWSLVGEGEAPFWEGPDEQAPIGMGTRYLVMAIVNKNQGVPVPFE